MGIADNVTNGSKGSNFNWQKRMLQMASECCIPVLTEAERTAFTTAGVGKVVYQSDGAEGLYVMTSGGWAAV